MRRAAKQIPLFPETEEPDPLSGFSVRESGRAKHLSIKVYPRGRVEVVVPKRTRARDVQHFVDEHRDWIRTTRQQFANEHPPEPFRLPHRIELTGIGETYRVRYEQCAARGNVRFRQGANLVTLSGNTRDIGQCVAALKRWLASVARREFEPRLRALSRVTGNAFTRMHVRGQKTCWGSHSSSGTISVNYCLLFLDPALVRYLMVHELCHAKHMNHSRRFWSHVARFEPDYRRLDRRLSDAWKFIPTWVGIY
ncbi:MAG: SprT family zinc-dependent metalloprotease [Woeseiaceae bacterium]|nr:SprT family zinc-dependent metalloprotease [Woeseiaceae bacterium]